MVALPEIESLPALRLRALPALALIMLEVHVVKQLCFSVKRELALSARVRPAQVATERVELPVFEGWTKKIVYDF